MEVVWVHAFRINRSNGIVFRHFHSHYCIIEVKLVRLGFTRVSMLWLAFSSFLQSTSIPLEIAFIHHLESFFWEHIEVGLSPSGLVPADQVTAATRASTCAYSTVASKFVRTTGLIKLEIGSPRSCSIIATILEPTIFLALLSGKRQSIGDCCFSSIFLLSPSAK